MYKWLPIFLALIFACDFAGSSTATAQPSFNCQNARTDMEKLICADAELSQSDQELANIYRSLLAAHPDRRQDIRRSQRQWLKQRNGSGCVGLPEREQEIRCVKSVYNERIESLQSKELLVCSEENYENGSFTVLCHALNDPLERSFYLGGIKENIAALQLLQIAINNDVVQSFEVEGAIWDEGAVSAIRLMDINFDGHSDIQLWTATSAGPNMGYTYYLYEPEYGRFVATGLGDWLSGFEIIPNPENETISVSGRSSCCSWVIQTFAWVDKKLQAITVQDEGVTSLRNFPYLRERYRPECVSATRHYDDHERLTHIDIEPAGYCPDEIDAVAEIAMFLSSLQDNPQGYSLDIQSEHHFTIVYDRPWHIGPP